MDGVGFVQSRGDFPCAVRVGGGGRRFAPSWSLSRWGRSGLLGFDPEEDEEGVLRGDARRFEYRGRRRSHRFTILDGERFEYDLILHREPACNVVRLRLDGAERLEFFRQPGWTERAELAGSWAVYGREANGAFGTGKLCHVYRPRIIDARGRRVWGELDISGGYLSITIPEAWLAEAAYPVVVDPVVGTSTVGANTQWRPNVGDPLELLYFETRLVVNRFLLAQACSGACTAYFYACYNAAMDGGGFPGVYGDNANFPTTKRSGDEGYVNMEVTSAVGGAWRSAGFTMGNALAAGTYLWFGVQSYSCFYPRFDYGARCYSVTPYPEDEYPISQFPSINPNNYYDFKLSMYFSYVVSMAFYSYVANAAPVLDAAGGRGDFRRIGSFLAGAADGCVRKLGWARLLADGGGPLDLVRQAASYIRRLAELPGLLEEVFHGFFVQRLARDTASGQDVAVRRVWMVVRLLSGVLSRDYLLQRLLFSREELLVRSRITKEFFVDSRV